MITLSEQGKKWSNGRMRFEFEGLSTDEKPVKEFEGYKIANGSTFLALDTQDVNFYDETNEKWV